MRSPWCCCGASRARSRRTTSCSTARSAHSLVGGFNCIPVWVPPDAIDWGLLFLVGVWGVFGSYAVIRAYRLGEASMLAPLEYTALIWSIMFDLWLFSLAPVPAVLVGAAIIIGSNVYIAHREHQLAKAAQ